MIVKRLADDKFFSYVGHVIMLGVDEEKPCVLLKEVDGESPDQLYSVEETVFKENFETESGVFKAWPKMSIADAMGI